MRQLAICSFPALFLLTALMGAAAPAGESPQRRAVTDPAEADLDFAFQGEYAGWVSGPFYGRRWVGLQVIARDKGNFEAAWLEGGLPGAGHHGPRQELAGSLEGPAVRLVSDEQIVLVDGQRALVHDTSGKQLGELHRIDRLSPTLGLRPPAAAVVLFDGASTEHLEGAKVTEDGLLQVGAITAMPVRDFRLHLEFRLPYMPQARGQGRANSGVYIQRRYEVQILDSFGLEGAFNECGALYRQQSPDVNMCLPPLTWQTYDIWFRAARFDDEGEKIANARITVLLNGVAVHSDREIPTKTGAGRPEGPDPLPILFQDHGNPVHFRNMWIVLEEPAAARYVVVAPCPRRPHRCLPVLRRIVSRIRGCR